jgi:hypothetical protein
VTTFKALRHAPLLDDTIVNSSGDPEAQFSYQRDIETSCTPFSLTQFLRENTSVKSMKLCAPHNRCKKKLCLTCSTRRASRDRAALRRYAASSGLSAIFVVLSLPSTPDLATGWQQLSDARARLRPYLTSTSTSWHRYTELTLTDEGWHPHDNIVIFGTDEQLDTIRRDLASRWSGRVYVKAVRDMHKVTAYATKGLMRPGTEGATPKDLLTRWAEQGDADAADRWVELEAFFSSRRIILSSRSRPPRGTTTTMTHRPGRPRSVHLGDVYRLGGRGLTVAQRARILRGKERTIQYRRAELRPYLRAHRAPLGFPL